MHIFPVTEPFREVTPWDAGTVTIQHRLDKQPIVRRGHADRECTARQSVLDSIPLVVVQGASVSSRQADRLRIEEFAAPESCMSPVGTNFTHCCRRDSHAVPGGLARSGRTHSAPDHTVERSFRIPLFPTEQREHPIIYTVLLSRGEDG